MQSNKLLINFILYVTVLVLVVFIVGGIVTYYYRAVKGLTEDLSSVSDLTRFDLYMLKTIKSGDVKIKNVGLADDENSYFVTLQKDDGSTYSFVKKGNILYFNQTKICENVDFFRVVIDKSEEESLNVDITISGESFNFQYAIG